MRYVQRRRLEFATLISIPLVWWIIVLLVPYVIMLMISFYRKLLIVAVGGSVLAP